MSGRYPQFTRRSFVIDFILGVLPFVLLMPFKALGDLLAFKKIKQRLGGKFRFTVSGGAPSRSTSTGFSRPSAFSCLKDTA